MAQVAYLLAQIALVAVALAVHRGALEPLTLGEGSVQHCVHMGPPKAPIQIQGVAPALCAGQGGVVLAAIGRVDVGDSIPQEGGVVGMSRLGVKQGVFGGDMPQLVVCRKQGRGHAGFQLGQLFRGDEAGGVAVVPIRLGHQRERILLVPRGADEHDAPVACDDVTQLLYDGLCSLPLRPADAVLEVYNVVADD